MTAIVGPGRMTKPWGPLPKPIRVGPYLMADGEIIYVGSIVCIDTADGGYAKKGQASTTLVPCGISPETYENTTTPDSFANLEAQGRGPTIAALGADGGLAAEAVQGCYPFFNDPGAGPVLMTNVGSSCYMLDDQTVSMTSSGHSKLGVVVLVDPVDGTIVVALDTFAGRP